MPRIKKSVPTEPPSCDVLLTPAEAAHRIGIAPGTLKNWSARGKGPRRYRMSPTFGGRVRYSEREVATFVEEVKAGALARPSKLPATSAGSRAAGVQTGDEA
ncbi:MULTISPECIES: helix-turn-helix transcriptional regulator [Streptomyces]|uniref:helix-turn-helix transcriptional regulator n=1 Tax=Streptomyces TaxID=1883 RepID=UPI00345BC004